ncbi:atpD [Symbiodinium natans]|uniref:AtpD protein n=1 Tax=Symbiodinium natans TaxID=878477 RepID=A0A812LKE1_9DINO|nr:atpD [Symbiodinium natans]
MGAYLRRERREREQQKDVGPLCFGNEAMSDEQLGSVLIMRNERLLEAAQQQRIGMERDPELAKKGWTSEALRAQLAPGVAERLEELAQRADEVSVDRYEELALEAEDMIIRQLDDLYADGGWEPGNTPPELVSKLGEDEDPFALNAAASSSAPPVWPLETPKEYKRSVSQSVRSGRDSTVAARRERERREAEAQERRRREELVEKHLQTPLPKEFALQSFETSRVSPASWVPKGNLATSQVHRGNAASGSQDSAAEGKPVLNAMAETCRIAGHNRHP